MERKESQNTYNKEVTYRLNDPRVRVKAILLSEIMENETVLLRDMTDSKFDL